MLYLLDQSALWLNVIADYIACIICIDKVKLYLSNYKEFLPEYVMYFSKKVEKLTMHCGLFYQNNKIVDLHGRQVFIISCKTSVTPNPNWHPPSMEPKLKQRNLLAVRILQQSQNTNQFPSIARPMKAFDCMDVHHEGN